MQTLGSPLGRRTLIWVVVVVLVSTTLALEVPPVFGQPLSAVMLVIAAGFFGSVGGYLIARLIVQPTRQLLETAERIRGGDLEARAESGQPGELGDLAHALADLAEGLRTSAGDIDEERRTLAAILEGMDDGVITLGSGGEILLANPAAERILQAPPGRSVGRDYVEVLRDHQLVELVRRCLASSRAGSSQLVGLEMPRRYLRVQAAPLDEGRVLVVLQDLTEIRRAETIRRDFVANVSHELRTPLASLKALVETLQDGALDDPPVARDFLERMNVELDGLTQLVRELLELSRIESGQGNLRIDLIDINDALSQVVDRFQTQADRGGLSLVVERTPGLPSIPADVDRVQMAISNLVQNAIKFTPPGGEIRVFARAARVRLNASFEILPLASHGLEANATGGSGTEASGTPPTHVLLTVADTGVGIPADERSRIFERFYKGDRARSGGGTGLGLAIVKHVAEAHGGRTWVESVEGKGSTFRIALPLPPAGSKKPPEAGASGGKPRT